MWAVFIGTWVLGFWHFQGNLGLWTWAVFTASWCVSIFMNNLFVWGLSVLQAFADAFTIALLFTFVGGTVCGKP